MLLTISGGSFIKIQYSSFPLFPVVYPFHSNSSQYYVKRKKCKVNDVIFPSVCEACAINLGNKNMKIGIFTGGTTVRSKNIFTDISRYSNGKHEISYDILSKHGRLPGGNEQLLLFPRCFQKTCRLLQTRINHGLFGKRSIVNTRRVFSPDNW